jgi:hypothetical protein
MIPSSEFIHSSQGTPAGMPGWIRRVGGAGLVGIAVAPGKSAPESPQGIGGAADFTI